NADGSITEAQPNGGQPKVTPRPAPPAGNAPAANAPAGSAPAARPATSAGNSPGKPRSFPESRIPDVIRRAKAAGMNLTADQAKKQLQSEGWIILAGQ